MIELAPLANAIFAPATRLTLDDEAFNEKLVAAGTVGPTMVMLLAPELNVMFAPATKLTLEDVPFSENPIAPDGVGPMMVIEGLVESWLRVMFGPATNANADEDAVFAVPEVAPPAVDAIEASVE